MPPITLGRPDRTDHPAGLAPATGTLRLQVERAPSGRSVAAAQFHSGALRVLRAHYPDTSGGAVFTIVNPGGGFLGEDRYEIDYDGGPASSALVTTQSATKVYRSPAGPARQFQRFDLAPGARLEYVPDPLIAYEGAQYRQTTEVRMSAGASFLTAEIVTPGWAASGEPFRYHEVRLFTRLWLESQLLLWDNLVMRPARTDPTSRGWLDNRTHLLSLTAVHPGIGADTVDTVRGIISDFPTLHAGCSLLRGPGLVVRALADSSGVLALLAEAIGTRLRRDQTGQSPWELRKY
ncbi:urease accessory protein UreD [Citricoccus sp. NPDC079358]|uniref:Urease accessory protein UreD n=1 Tax=Citricoccus muralis TaxID=169134 RepID=A0A3D9LFK6_9MICC|nr:urease accessory protein UreD [Citricoccus muralis]REE04197.1 urease accessory protein [Citricoccus muralis]